MTPGLIKRAIRTGRAMLMPMPWNLTRSRHSGTADFILSVLGIRGEPVTWQPQLDIIHDLDLPGPDPAFITITELHRTPRRRQAHAAEEMPRL